MITDNEIQSCFSNGEDVSIERFFEGREVELENAITAIQQNKLVLVDGYTLAGKTYFALKCLEKLGIQVNVSSRMTSNLSDSQNQYGVFVPINQLGYTYIGLEVLINKILLGSGEFKGLISQVPEASKRREFTQLAISLNSESNGTKSQSNDSLENHIQLLENIIRHLKDSIHGNMQLLICLDNINFLKPESHILQLIARLMMSDVRFLITQNTNLPSSSRFDIQGQFNDVEFVKIGRMGQVDVNSIIAKIEQNIDCKYSFSQQSKDLIYDLSGGLPYFVHYLCGGSMQVANNTETNAIEIDTIEKLIHRIREGHYPALIDKLFEAVTKSSKQLLFLHNYINQEHNDLAYSLELSNEEMEMPVGVLFELNTPHSVIASPPIHVYARLIIGSLFS
jgi:hypothetical protein